MILYSVILSMQILYLAPKICSSVLHTQIFRFDHTMIDKMKDYGVFAKRNIGMTSSQVPRIYEWIYEQNLNLWSNKPELCTLLICQAQAGVIAR